MKTPDDSAKLQSIAPALGIPQAKVDGIRAEVDGIRDKVSEVSARKERIGGIIDPMDEAQIQKAVLSELVATRQLELLRTLRDVKKSELETAEAELRYEVSRLSREIVGPILRQRFDILAARIRGEVLSRFPGESQHFILNAVESNSEFQSARATLHAIQSGLWRVSDLVAVVENLLAGQEIWGMTFRPAAGPPVGQIPLARAA